MLFYCSGRAVFCEKPISQDEGGIRACYELAADVQKPLFCSFNRLVTAVPNSCITWVSHADRNSHVLSKRQSCNDIRKFAQCLVIFTALLAMQTRSSDENSVRLFVCPSVRPSVCQTSGLWQNGRKICQIFIPYERAFSLVFCEEEWLVGCDPFYLKFWVIRSP